VAEVCPGMEAVPGYDSDMANRKDRDREGEEPGSKGNAEYDAASAMYRRAREAADLAGAMTRRAHEMAGEDQQSRRRLAAIREDMIAPRERRTPIGRSGAGCPVPAEASQCASCGLSLWRGEDSQRCHRCRDETCEQARIDWEAAQTAWSLSQALRPLPGEVDSVLTSGGAPPVGAGSANLRAAEFEQREIEWEQARTSWHEALDARAERARRDPG
jgi:hypothetical protein